MQGRNQTSAEGPSVARDKRNLVNENMRLLESACEVIDPTKKPSNQVSPVEANFPSPGFKNNGFWCYASYLYDIQDTNYPTGRWTYGGIVTRTNDNVITAIKDESLDFMGQPVDTTLYQFIAQASDNLQMSGLKPAHFQHAPFNHNMIVMDNNLLVPIGIRLDKDHSGSSTVGVDANKDAVFIRSILAPGIPETLNGPRSGALELGPTVDGMGGLAHISSPASVSSEKDEYYQLGRGYYKAGDSDQAMGFISDAYGCNKTAHRNSKGIKGAHIDITAFYYLDALRDGPKAFHEDQFQGVAGTGTIYEVQHVFDTNSGTFRWQVAVDGDDGTYYNPWGFWSWDGTGDKYPPPPPPDYPYLPIKKVPGGNPPVPEPPEDDGPPDDGGDDTADGGEPDDEVDPPDTGGDIPPADDPEPDNPDEVPDPEAGDPGTELPCYIPPESPDEWGVNQAFVIPSTEDTTCNPDYSVRVVDSAPAAVYDTDNPADPVNWMLGEPYDPSATTSPAPAADRLTIPSGPKPKTQRETGMPSLHVLARSSSMPAPASGENVDYGGTGLSGERISPFNDSLIQNPGVISEFIDDGLDEFSGRLTKGQLKYKSQFTTDHQDGPDLSYEKAESTVFLGYSEENTDGTLKKQSAEGKGYQVPSTDNNGVFIAPSDVTLQNEDGTTTQKTNVLLHTDRTQLAFGLPSQDGVYDSVFKIETDAVSGLKYLVIDVTNLTGGIKITGLTDATTGDSDSLYKNGGTFNIEP